MSVGIVILIAVIAFVTGAVAGAGLMACLQINND